jgi:hypothetical protein
MRHRVVKRADVGGNEAKLSRATADQKKGPEGDGVLKSSVKAAAIPN